MDILNSAGPISPQGTRRRRPVAVLAALCGGMMLAGCASSGAPATPTEAKPSAAAAPASQENLYTAAVAWRVTAAERDMLYRQGFNLAKDRLDAALAAPHAKPLAIISDIDDTVLSSDAYWEKLLAEGGQAFDDKMWDEWVTSNGPTATPGAVEFTQYAASKGVEVFYVSQRDQGDNTQQIGVANLKHVGLAFADDAHVTIQRESSDKEAGQKAVADRFDVVAYLGDNLNDFARRYYVDNVADRKKLASADAEEFGRKFILFPNPTDGHWLKAIFGSSEPEDSPEYREKFAKAAAGQGG